MNELIKKFQKDALGNKQTTRDLRPEDACNQNVMTGKWECPDDSIKLEGVNYFEDADGNTFRPKVSLGNLKKAIPSKYPLTSLLTIENSATDICCKGDFCQDFNEQANRCTNAMGLDLNNLLKDDFDRSAKIICIENDFNRGSARAKKMFKDAKNAAKE